MRPGVEADLEPALELYHATFPEGSSPTTPGATASPTGSVYLAERDGRPLAFLNIDPNDRWAYQIGVAAGALARRGQLPPPRACSRTTGAAIPASVLGLSVEADNTPALRPPTAGLRPWLVLQSYELWL